MKNDEFYTQLGDIEKEMLYYREHFRGKVVYCNCDDPTVSNFHRFFKRQFDFLGLKKLITTCYRNDQPDLFSNHDSDRAVVLEYDGKEPAKVFRLKGDGDFRSEECINILKQADIISTNPPFSLIHAYFAQLLKYKKKFIILGPMTAYKSKDNFPVFQDFVAWFGVNRGAFSFEFPGGGGRSRHSEIYVGTRI